MTYRLTLPRPYDLAHNSSQQRSNTRPSTRVSIQQSHNSNKSKNRREQFIISSKNHSCIMSLISNLSFASLEIVYLVIKIIKACGNPQTPYHTMITSPLSCSSIPLLLPPRSSQNKNMIVTALLTIPATSNPSAASIQLAHPAPTNAPANMAPKNNTCLVLATLSFANTVSSVASWTMAPVIMVVFTSGIFAENALVTCAPMPILRRAMTPRA